MTTEQRIKGILKNTNEETRVRRKSQSQEFLLASLYRLENFIKKTEGTTTDLLLTNVNGPCLQANGTFNFRTLVQDSSTVPFPNRLSKGSADSVCRNTTTRRRGILNKLQNILQRKVDVLFEPVEYFDSESCLPTRSKSNADYYATVPPLDFFCNADVFEKKQQFFKDVQVGDLVICAVLQSKDEELLLQVLSMDAHKRSYIENLDVSGVCRNSDMIPYQSPDPENPRTEYMKKDLVRCEVLAIEKFTEMLMLGMQGLTVTLKDPNIQKVYKLGAVFKSDLPKEFLNAREESKKSKLDGEIVDFQKCLGKNLGFQNPYCVTNLAKDFGVLDNKCTLISSLRCPFEIKDYAAGLRAAQDSVFALSYVKAGIAYFKKGDITQAFENIDKALIIDPKNVAGLVALGCLHNKKEDFEMAIRTFEEALKIQPESENAKKFLLHALMEMSERCHKEFNFDAAFTHLTRCLQIRPDSSAVKDLAQSISNSFTSYNKQNMMDADNRTLTKQLTLMRLVLNGYDEHLTRHLLESSTSGSTSLHHEQDQDNLESRIPHCNEQKVGDKNTLEAVSNILSINNGLANKVVDDLQKLDAQLAEDSTKLDEVLLSKSKDNGTTKTVEVQKIKYVLDKHCNLINSPRIAAIVNERTAQPLPPSNLGAGSKKFVMTFKPISNIPKSLSVDKPVWDSPVSQGSNLDVNTEGERLKESLNIDGKPMKDKPKESPIPTAKSSTRDETSSISSRSTECIEKSASTISNRHVKEDRRKHSRERPRSKRNRSPSTSKRYDRRSKSRKKHFRGRHSSTKSRHSSRHGRRSRNRPTSRFSRSRSRSRDRSVSRNRTKRLWSKSRSPSPRYSRYSKRSRSSSSPERRRKSYSRSPPRRYSRSRSSESRGSSNRRSSPKGLLERFRGPPKPFSRRSSHLLGFGRNNFVKSPSFRSLTPPTPLNGSPLFPGGPY